MIRTFIQLTALILTLEAAIFLAKGNLGLSPKVIAELSSTKWDYNTDVIGTLASQRADTWVGIVLLLCAFGFQLWNSLWPMRIGDFGVNAWGILSALFLGIVVYLGANIYARKLSRTTDKQVREILTSDRPPGKP
jgi:hypothetical protein